MILNKDQFPVVVQAYEMVNNKEIFLAEQIVSNQSEVDTFANRYIGKLIKARALTSAEASSTNAIGSTTKSNTYAKKSNTGLVIWVILIVLIILIAIGFYTGWIQNNFGINL